LVKRESRNLIKRAVESVDDFLMGYVELMRDTIFEKIPKERRLELINYAIETGQNTARNIAKEYGTKNVISIAKKLGVEVVYSPNENVIGGIKKRADYLMKPPTIIVYKESISEILHLTKHQPFRTLKKEEIVAAHIAHELFHHIERTRIGQVSQRFKVDIVKLGPFRIRSGIRSLSEIAAHSFAKAMLNLPYSPKIFDLYFNQNAVTSRVHAWGN